jgi:hypothetical protein
MRACPAVAVCVCAGTAWRLVQASLCVAAAASLAAWAVQHLELGAAGHVVTALTAVVAAAVGWRSSHLAPVQLAWSGSNWRVGQGSEGMALTAPPMVAIDLGAWMLIRVRTGTGAAWLPVSRAVAGASWHLWRAAVYSPAPGSLHRSPEERPTP